jgi:predicted HTH transcriptional regulator
MNSIVQHSVYEKYVCGIERIINYFKEANLPLSTFRLTQGSAFENHSSGFLVTVFAPDNKRLSENVTEKRTKHILEAIRIKQKITTVILSRQLNIANDFTQRSWKA